MKTTNLITLKRLISRKTNIGVKRIKLNLKDIKIEQLKSQTIKSGIDSASKKTHSFNVSRKLIDESCFFEEKPLKSKKKVVKRERKNKKTVWIGRVRTLRKILKLRKKELSSPMYRQLYLKIKGNVIKTRNVLDKKISSAVK